MRRKFFTFASLLSLLLCLITVALWVCTSNGVMIWPNWKGVHIEKDRTTLVGEWPMDPPMYFWGAFGFENHPRRLLILIPYWSLASMLVILPAISLIGKLKRRRSKTGECQHCGYNLTGNASGVCPECGTAVAGKAGA